MKTYCSKLLFYIFSQQIKVKITKTFDWHVEGEIIEKKLEVIQVPEDYVEKMKLDLQG